jgi:hypothetical protein
MAPRKKKKPKMSWKSGGCHCGAVAYEVEVPDEIELIDCNCSICTDTGYLHLIVAKSQFKLLKGEDKLTTYTFGTAKAKHMFCSICGVKSFYVPRSHPEGYSINYRCLNAQDFTSVITTQFEGKYWEEHAEELTPIGSE